MCITRSVHHAHMTSSKLASEGPTDTKSHGEDAPSQHEDVSVTKFHRDISYDHRTTKTFPLFNKEMSGLAMNRMTTTMPLLINSGRLEHILVAWLARAVT